MPDFRKAEKINLEEFGRYFESLGYKVINLEQKWRHVTGTVLFENEKLFVKLASTEDIGLRTTNEAQFGKNYNRVWSDQIYNFKIPKTFDDGYFQRKYWFVREFIFGKPIAEVDKQIATLSIADFEKSAEIASELMKISDIALTPKDIEHMKEMWKKRVVEVAKFWSKDTKQDTYKLLRFIKDQAENVEIGTSHGDFVPWHIYKTKDKKYYLVDCEASQIAGLRHFDAAYFYQRTYTKLKKPDLADLFIKRYKVIENFTDKDEEAFRLALASRVMGGYIDADRDGVTSVELNNQIEMELLKKMTP